MQFLFVFTISLIGLFFLLYNTFLFLKNKSIHNYVSSIFLWYLVLLSIIETSCHIIGFLKPNANLFISHFYFIFQFSCLSYLYYCLFKETILKKMIMFFYIFQMLILMGTYYFNFQLFWGFNIYEIVSCSSILVAYAFLYIFKNLEKEHTYFNFSVGLIFYLLCSISIFTSGNLELVLWEDPYIDIWIFNSLFYIFFQYMIFKEYKSFTLQREIRNRL
jgi:hypothetical protein